MPKDRPASPLQRGHQGRASCPKAPSARALGCILCSKSVFGSYFPIEISCYRNNPPREDTVVLPSLCTFEISFGRRMVSDIIKS